VAQSPVLPPDLSPATKLKVQISIVETCRYYLAGFSKSQIIEEVYPPPTPPDIASKLYDATAGTIGEVTCTNPQTGESFTPTAWNAAAAFGIKPGPLSSISFSRTQATCEPMMAYVDGDYEKCVKSASLGADAFGRHAFYQFNMIANQRLGREDAANEAIAAAVNGTQLSQWHYYLALLTAGELDPEELVEKAPDSSHRHQVRCFQGARALTLGENEKAKAILTVAKLLPTDFVTEMMIVDADLGRC
jgi:hypothetical protein